MKKNVYCIVVLTVAFVVLHVVQEDLHVISGNGFTLYTVIDQHILHLKLKGVVTDNLIIDRHLKGWSDYSPDGVNRTVAASSILHVDQPEFSIGTLDGADALLCKILFLKGIHYKVVVCQGVGLHILSRCKIPGHEA